MTTPTGTPEPRPGSAVFDRLYDEYWASGHGSWEAWLAGRPVRTCSDCGDQLCEASRTEREGLLNPGSSESAHLDDGTPACASRDQANARRDRQNRPRIGHRSLSEIAREIARDWPRPYFGAEPYIQAMRYLTGMGSRYGQDHASDIVMYFLANARTWRGDTARSIKAELKGMLK